MRFMGHLPLRDTVPAMPSQSRTTACVTGVQRQMSGHNFTLKAGADAMLGRIILEGMRGTVALIRVNVSNSGEMAPADQFGVATSSPKSGYTWGSATVCAPCCRSYEGDKAPGCVGPGSSRSWSRCACNRIP